MNAPQGVAIGSRWTAKRGRRCPDATILQIHRADRAVTTLIDGARRVLTWRELRADRKPSQEGGGRG